ncbi:Protein FAM8A1, partial [Lamprotornis superbus]
PFYLFAPPPAHTAPVGTGPRAPAAATPAWSGAAGVVSPLPRAASGSAAGTSGSGASRDTGRPAGREFLIPSLAHRFIAEMVDFFILFFIKAIIILSIMHLSGIKDISKFAMHYIIEEIDEDTSMEDLQKMMIVALIYRLLVCFYEIICIWGAGGATPGKFLLGLRVVTCETSVLIAPSRVLVIPSSNVSMTTSTVRALIKNFSIASFFPAFITLLFFQHNRTAYDIVAGTIVHWGYQSQKLADGLPAVRTRRAECCLSPSQRQKEQGESQQKTTLSTVIQNLERFAGWSLGLGQMLVADWRQRLGQQQALEAQSQTETKTMILGGQRGIRHSEQFQEPFGCLNLSPNPRVAVVPVLLEVDVTVTEFSVTVGIVRAGITPVPGFGTAQDCRCQVRKMWRADSVGLWNPTRCSSNGSARLGTGKTPRVLQAASYKKNPQKQKNASKQKKKKPKRTTNNGRCLTTQHPQRLICNLEFVKKGKYRKRCT